MVNFRMSYAKFEDEDKFRDLGTINYCLEQLL